jgi:hypothetical protein
MLMILPTVAAKMMTTMTITITKIASHNHQLSGEAGCVGNQPNNQRNSKALLSVTGANHTSHSCSPRAECPKQWVGPRPSLLQWRPVGAGELHRFCRWMPARRRWLWVMQLVAVQRKAALRVLFAMWASSAKDSLNKQLKDEVQRLTQLLGKQATSLWMMNNSQVVDVAVKELGISREEAEARRKEELQHLIRKNRGSTTQGSGLPKGLARMTHAERVQECVNRGICTEDTTRRSGRKAREQMILDIKAYEAARSISASPTVEEMETEYLMMGLAGELPNFSASAAQQPEASGLCSSARAEGVTEAHLRMIWADPHLQQLLADENNLPMIASLLRAPPQR